MHYKDPKFIVTAIVIVLVLWGFIGGLITNKVTHTCDVGFWELCWTWHKNLVGVFVEVLK